MEEEKKITKQGCSKKFMKAYIEKGLEEKTITKTKFNAWKKTVKAIEDGEGTEKDKLKKVKSAFYDTFIKTEKKNTHPLYDMFSEINNKPKEDK